MEIQESQELQELQELRQNIVNTVILPPKFEKALGLGFRVYG